MCTYYSTNCATVSPERMYPVALQPCHAYVVVSDVHYIDSVYAFMAYDSSMGTAVVFKLSIKVFSYCL